MSPRRDKTTIPSALRKKLGIEEGDRVMFQETEEGLVVKPVTDVEDSAGALSRFGDAREVLHQLLQERRKKLR